MSSLEQSQENEIQEIVHPISLSNDDKQQEIQSLPSSDHQNSNKDMLSNERKLIFDKAFGDMLTRRFYLIEHEFPSSDRFEGLVLTYDRHQYKIIITHQPSCSCKKFKKDYVCKHFLFVLKRIFNADLYSSDLRASIMEYHLFTDMDLRQIFQGQLRRLSPIASPVSQMNKKEKLVLSFKRQSIDLNDVCPICFERLLTKSRKLVTCFYSCGKSMHKNCMKELEKVKGKSTNCPYCQVQWINPGIAEKAVLNYYAHLLYPVEKHEKYILCCLYTPPECSM